MYIKEKNMSSTDRRTITCPTGCHEDYLDRDPFENYDSSEQVVDYGSHYECRRCEWRATWSRQDGFVVEQEAVSPFDLDGYIYGK